MHPLVIEPIIRNALLEDLGHGRDITSQATIPSGKKATAVMRAREAGVIAGIDVAVMAFQLVDNALNIETFVQNGGTVSAGADILNVSGNAQSILIGERVALNFASHLSGIATATTKYVEAIAGTKAKICCTRKTLPGLRVLQKAAVLAGGGANHRFGLDDCVLIKDNHIAVAGGIAAVLDATKNKIGHTTKIEIEVDTLDQLREVMEHGGADIVMLDNMAPDMLKKAVSMVDGTMITEASGGITLKNVRDIAEAGVDYISVGALTHSVTVLDLGLDISI